MVDLQSATTVVFDFGGVLFRWQPMLLLPQVLAHRQLSATDVRDLIDELFESFRPGSDWSEFDRGALSVDQLVPRLALRSGLSEHEARAIVEAVPAHLEPQPGVLALLQQLKRDGERLCFLSNMPEVYVDYLERHHAFLSIFEAGLYSSRIGLVKPDRAIFDYAERHLTLDPATTIFIDDNPANIVQARACGWQAIQFVDAQDCARQLGYPLAA